MAIISLIDRYPHAEKGPRRIQAFRQDMLGLGLLAVASLGIGLLLNGRRAHPLPLGYVSPNERLKQTVTQMVSASPVGQPPTPVSRPWKTMSLDEFQAFVAARQGVSIDARAQVFYRAGHIPGALSLPREDFEKGYAAVRRLLGPAGERPIVVYCSEADCKDSELVADALSRLGYRPLYVYSEGWEEWSHAGLPQEASTGP